MNSQLIMITFISSLLANNKIIANNYSWIHKAKHYSLTQERRRLHTLEQVQHTAVMIKTSCCPVKHYTVNTKQCFLYPGFYCKTFQEHVVENTWTHKLPIGTWWNVAAIFSQAAPCQVLSTFCNFSTTSATIFPKQGCTALSNVFCLFSVNVDKTDSQTPFSRPRGKRAHLQLYWLLSFGLHWKRRETANKRDKRKVLRHIINF